MESTGVVQVQEKGAASVAPTANPTLPASLTKAVHAPEVFAVGYGMPCANCRAYYPSDMSACPICHSKLRISPNGSAAPQTAIEKPFVDEAKSLAEAREHLRELTAKISASQAPVIPAPVMRCALDQNHLGEVEPAAICHSCYGVARQESDRLEAALHMDYKEAAKIVYDAVWADTSDPTKSYYNAAHALLVELRKRAGIAPPFGARKPLSH